MIRGGFGSMFRWGHWKAVFVIVLVDDDMGDRERDRGGKIA